MEPNTLAFLVLLLAFGIMVNANRKLTKTCKNQMAEIKRLQRLLDEHIGWPTTEEED
jgi:hypothetical protein